MPPTIHFVSVAEHEKPSSVQKKISALFEAAGLAHCVSDRDLVAIKLHIGEKGNTTHLPAFAVKPVVDRIKQAGGKPFLTDTNTLYRGQRSNAVDHLNLAHEHGFTLDRVGAPMIISDGLFGTSEREVEVNGDLYASVAVASEVVMANALIVLTHPTGHPGMGLGATLKNLGMGFSSRKGKLAQHSKMLPKIDKDKCTRCGTCVKWCPQDTIEMLEASAFVHEQHCIGCGECLAVCRFGAVLFDWNVSSRILQKRVAEHAYAATKDKPGKVGYLSFLITITKGCDCSGSSQKPLVPNIGILASKDPVAIDQATLDLVHQRTGKSFRELTYPDVDPQIQLAHAQKLGLGQREYTLVHLQQ